MLTVLFYEGVAQIFEYLLHEISLFKGLKGNWCCDALSEWQNAKRN